MQGGSVSARAVADTLVSEISRQDGCMCKIALLDRFIDDAGRYGLGYVGSMRYQILLACPVVFSLLPIRSIPIEHKIAVLGVGLREECHSSDPRS